MSRRPRGELESVVLRVLWDAQEPLPAREVRARIGAHGGVEPALTTVLTVLDRLRAKGHVRREAGPDGSLSFGAVQSESAHVAREMLDALVSGRDRSAALMSFAGDLAPEDLALLQRAAKRPGRRSAQGE